MLCVFFISGCSTPTPTDATNVATGIGGPCPEGSYCPAQTEDPIPCPQGTFSDAQMLTAESECTQCLNGQFCGSSNLTAPTGDCDPGFYCYRGNSQSNPDGSDPAMGGPCPVSHYCPQGTSNPIACPAGTYNNVTQQSQCAICPEGFYCPENTTTYEVMSFRG